MSDTEFILIIVFLIIGAACCIPIVIGMVAKRILKRRHPDSKYLKKISPKAIPNIVYVVIVGIGAMYIVEVNPPKILQPALESQYGFIVKMAVLFGVLYIAGVLLGVLRFLIIGNSNENDT